MTIHKTLYSKDSLQKIRIWFLEQNDDKYRTVSGVKDSDNLVTSEWTVALPKNEGKANATTGEQQATAEIEATYKKKLKNGYFISIKDVDNFQYVEPMLAKNYKDYADKIDFSKESWGVQCKFNGNRCIATAAGLFTRKGEKYVNVKHIEDSLASFFEKQPLAVLDGELANYSLRQKLNELNKLIRKTVHITSEDEEKSKELVKYYIYDGYSFESLGAATPYKARKYWIDKNIIGKYDFVEEVKTFPIKKITDLEKQYEIFINDGEEGAILRNLDEGYQNKRTKFLLKLKPEDDSEGVILDILSGEGNWSNTGKIITLKWKDKTFNATLKGTYEQAADFLKNKNQYIGREVTFLFNGLTGLGVPNFCRVDFLNCFKN